MNLFVELTEDPLKIDHTLIPSIQENELEGKEERENKHLLNDEIVQINSLVRN